MKKLLLLTTALLISLASMAYDFKVDGICYSETEGGFLEVVPEDLSENNYKDLVNAVIPDEFEYEGRTYWVLYIADNAFNGAQNLETIEVAGLTIGNSAFANTPKLKTAKFIGDISLGSYVFNGSAIESLKLPSKMYNISETTFIGASNLAQIEVNEKNPDYDSRENCNAVIETATNTLIVGCKNTTIPSTVTAIGEMAFNNVADLKLTEIPSNVIKVGAGAFHGTPLCPHESSGEAVQGPVYINHILYSYNGEMPANTTFTVKEGTTCIAGNALWGYSNLVALKLPEGLKSIGAQAFDATSLTSIVIPEDVIYVGKNAFDRTQLESVTWNAVDCDTEIEGTSTIKSSVFGTSCYNINSFTFGEKVEKIPYSLCEGMEKVNQITLHPSVKYIQDNAFEHTGIFTITIPENVETIGEDVFDCCPNITSVVWNAKNCKRTTARKLENYEFISSLFPTNFQVEEEYRGVSSITFGSEVTNIPESMFHYNEFISSITLPESLKTIEEKAFAYCSNIKSVTIPENVTYIGKEAFDHSGLETVNFEAEVEEIHPEAFAYTPWWESYYESLPDGPIYLSKRLIGYKGEMLENTTINVKEGTTTILEDVFANQENLVAVTFPESLKEIGANAFLGCANLKEITIPEGVVSIGENAFDGTYLEKVTWNAVECNKDVENNIFNLNPDWDDKSSITSFTFGNNVKYIPSYLCYGLDNVESFVLPNSLEEIGKSAFVYIEVESITIPENVKKIAKGAFYETSIQSVIWNAINCEDNSKTHSISYITGESEISYFKNEYFSYKEGCSYVWDFVFGNKVEHIPGALCYDLPLHSIIIPESVKSIGEKAFYSLDYIKQVNIPAGVKSIGKNAIEGPRLETITVDENNEVYASQDGILYDKGFTTMIIVPKSVGGEINIKGTVINVEQVIFDLRRSLYITAFNVEESNPFVCSLDGVLYNKDKSKLYLYPILKTDEVFVMPSEVKTVGTLAIEYNQSLNKVVLSQNLEIINSQAFYLCEHLEEVVCFEGLKKIEAEVFAYCWELKHINLPESLELIGAGAFMECSSLESIIIPAAVEVLSYNAFYDCVKLRNIYCNPKQIPTLDYWDTTWEDELVDGEGEEVYPFSNFDANLYVPASALEDYKFHPIYGEFKYIIPMGEITEPVERVAVATGETSAVFTWPAVENASSYTLTIRQGFDIICVLDFNANGQLIGMVINPTIRSASEATGFQFTVTGLEGSTEYGYVIEAKDADKCIIEDFEGGFTTKGDVTDVEETTASKVIVSDGTISCDADFAIYNISGLDVTAQNGNLTPGVYVVSTANETIKVLLK